MGSILDVVGIVFKPVADYFARKQEISAQEHQNELDALKAQGERQAQLHSQGLTADAAWEQAFAQQAATSWKDEYTLLVISIPAVMAFIPRLQPYVVQGFKAMDGTPLWYQLIFGSIFLATYGIRYWRRTQSDT